MNPIFPGQFQHLVSRYRKVTIPDLNLTVPEKKQLPSGASSRTKESEAGLEPFAGEWTDMHLKHLMKRTGFGVPAKLLDKLKGKALEDLLENILNANNELEAPINNYNDAAANKFDPEVPEGQSFVLAKFHQDLEGDRIVSLKGWMVDRALGTNETIQEKMFLFWWNFLPIKLWEVFIAKSCFRYIQMLHRNVLGNFKTMIRELIKDPAMLVFLSGAYNTKEAPDENFARELQELFCIGKGKDAFYTEADVQAVARVLTGWTVDWDSIHQTGAPKSVFLSYRHEEADKHFSAFYGNQVIKGRTGDSGAEELEDLLDMIFDHPETALHLARKLYTFFVNSEISQSAEDKVIAPMALLIRQHDYELLPALKILLGSAHFFHPNNMGTLIKSPMDFLLGIWRTLDLPRAGSPMDKDKINRALVWRMAELGMEAGDPPNVAGWQPYYQAPLYDQLWINTNTISKRALITDSIILWGFWISENLQYAADLLSFVNGLTSPEDPEKMLQEFVSLNLGFSLSDRQLQQAKKTLVAGQENDGYWTSAWQSFEDEPQNEEMAGTVLNRLKPTFQMMMQMAEAQLM